MPGALSHLAREAHRRVAVGGSAGRGAGGIRASDGGLQPVRFRRSRPAGGGRAGIRPRDSRTVPAAIPVGLRRRVPGRGRAAGPAPEAARSPGRQPLRHRRSGPGHLRLPGRGRAFLRGVSAGFPGGRGRAADPQLSLRSEHRRPLVPGDRPGGLRHATGSGRRGAARPRHHPRDPHREGRGRARRPDPGAHTRRAQLLLHRQRAFGAGRGTGSLLLRLRRSLPHRSAGAGAGRGVATLGHAFPAPLAPSLCSTIRGWPRWRMPCARRRTRAARCGSGSRPRASAFRPGTRRCARRASC